MCLFYRHVNNFPVYKIVTQYQMPCSDITVNVLEVLNTVPINERNKYCQRSNPITQSS